MKAKTSKKAKTLASTIIFSLVIASVLCLSVAAYLHLIEQQNFLSARSQAWNMAIAIVEAGIEEALAQLNSNPGNLSADGWAFDGTVYSRTRSLPGDNSYTVTIDVITDPLNPSIVSRAYIHSPIFAQNSQPVFFATVGNDSYQTTPELTRGVRAHAKQGSMFIKAMVAKRTINLNGNNILTDSFDSGNALYSTGGQYDPKKAGDKGDVASNDTIVDSVSAANANIYGHVATGPGGTVYVGSNGGIGEHSWQKNNNGIEPGGTPAWVTHDSNFTFPTVLMPNGSGYLTPTSGNVVTTTMSGTNVIYSTNYYDNILVSGNYKTGSLSGKTIVVGQALLCLPDGLKMSGGDTITIANTGSLTAYAGGNSCSLSGNSVINQSGYAANFVLYCAQTVTSVDYNGNATFLGVLVAPNADITMNGSGHTPIDFVGALIVNSVVMNGQFRFHYDEALGRIPNNGRFLLTSWDEIK